MKLTTIFQKYKKEYKLKTKLVFDNLITEDSYGKAFYCTSTDTIILKKDPISADKVVFLLHEIGHAIQNKRGVLEKFFCVNIDALYALEQEAQNFALKEFYINYKYIGKRTRKSCLKSKEIYAKFLMVALLEANEILSR